MYFAVEGVTEANRKKKTAATQLTLLILSYFNISLHFAALLF